VYYNNTVGAIGIGVIPTEMFSVSGNASISDDVRVDKAVRIGNAIYSIYRRNLPTTPSGWSTDPLHMKTNWVCGVTEQTMYSLVFNGYHLRGSSEINIKAVGYLYGASGHVKDNVRNISGTASATTYCSAVDSHLVFKLTLSSGDPDWHASDIVVHFDGGGSVYLKNGADTVSFSEVVNSATNI